MPRKSAFMDVTVDRGFIPDGTVMILPTLWRLSHNGLEVPGEIAMITSSTISSRSWR